MCDDLRSDSCYVTLKHQSEIQLKGEVAVRNQLLHAMAEQQNLMDALTAVSSHSAHLLLLLLTICVHGYSEGCCEAPRGKLLTQEWVSAAGTYHYTAD